MLMRPAVRNLRPPSVIFRTTRHTLRRAFHSTRPNHIVNEALQLSHQCFQSVHELTGLSWAYSIPLTAILFRAAWFYPSWWATSRMARAREYMPLLAAKRQHLQLVAASNNHRRSEKDAIKAEKEVRVGMRKAAAYYRGVFKSISPWTNGAVTFSFLPVWLFNADVVRRMCGMDTSLLAWLFGTGQKIDPTIVPPEMTLATESFLWVPELASADALWGLPLVFMALQMASGWLTIGKSIMGWKADLKRMGPGHPQAQTTKLYINLGEFLFAFILCSPAVLVYYQVPAAVVLFMIGSVSSQLAQRFLLRRMVASGKTYKPIRMKLPKMKEGLKSTIDDRTRFGGTII